MNRSYTIEECKRRIAEHFPQVPLHELVPIETGWDSFVVEVNGEYIFRFPLRQDVIPYLEKEMRLLPELRETLSLPVPNFEFIAPACLQADLPFVGYRKIPGEELTPRLCASPSIATQLGRFLTELHTFPLDKAIQLILPPGDTVQWRENYLGFYTHIHEHVFPLLDEPAREVWSTRWNNYLNDESNFQFRPTLIHCDLGSDHILCRPEEQVVTGIIDWGDASIGDPVFDFVGLFWIGGRDFVTGILPYYQGSFDDNAWHRIRFYNDIIPFHQILYGIMYDLEDHLQQGLTALHQNLNEWNR